MERRVAPVRMAKRFVVTRARWLADPTQGLRATMLATLMEAVSTITALPEPSKVRRRPGRNGGDDCEDCGRSDPERPDPDLRRHQPHETPGQRVLECPSI